MNTDKHGLTAEENKPWVGLIKTTQIRVPLCLSVSLIIPRLG